MSAWTTNCIDVVDIEQYRSVWSDNAVKLDKPGTLRFDYRVDV